MFFSDLRLDSTKDEFCYLLLFLGLNPRSSSAGHSRRTCFFDSSSSSQNWQVESSWLLNRARLAFSLLCPVLSLNKTLVMFRDL
jgi:hypothetical protein